MELYYMIGVTERKKSQTLLDICKELNMPMVLTNLARGTATSEHLSLHNLDRSEKAVVSTVTDAAGVRRLMRQAKLKLYIDIPGNGIMMAILLKSVAGGRTLAYLTGGKALEGGKPDMDFEYELIVVILNEGYSELVMDAARAAGARGGTVLHAKGTGAAVSEKFLGVSLAQEKDMVYIVASSKQKAEIMRSVSQNAGTGTKAGAICFTLPISEVAGLRQFDEE